MNNLITNIKLEETYLWEYRQAIKKRKIRAGREMILELDRLIEEFKEDEYIYNIDDAYARIDFIENCVKLTKSPFYGKPMKLQLWQKAFIEVSYSFKIKSIDTGGWVDRFQEILLLISRKNGKSETISALELTEMFLGNPGSDIVCSGTNDNIADLCYQAVDKMRLLIDPDSLDTWRNQKGITCTITNNKIFKLSDSSRGKEGRNIDFAGLDEIHELLDDGIYSPIQQSTSVKDSYKIFMFSSEGFTNDGFLDQKTEEYRKIIYGEDDSESAKRMLPWFYTQDSELEVWETDEEGINLDWEKSNPSIGAVKKWSYLKDRVDKARRSRSDRIFTLAKDFDFKVSNAEAWLDLEDYSYLAGFELESFRGSICLGAVDLAETTDMCSAKILLMKPNDKTKYIYQMYWIPRSKLENSDDKNAGADYSEWARQGFIRIEDDNEVDGAHVADWFAEIYHEYDIKTFVTGYDSNLSKAFIKQMNEYGFETDIVLQKREVMSNPMKLLETELKDQLVNFNNNPIDTWCLKNTSVQVWDTGLIMPVKLKGQSAHRIDGAVSLIILYETYRRNKKDFITYIENTQ